MTASGQCPLVFEPMKYLERGLTWLAGKRMALLQPVHPEIVGWSAGFSPLRRRNEGEILKFPDRSAVLKLKRRKRHAPLPTTSGCTVLQRGSTIELALRQLGR